jgi:hypothetical protein
MGCVIVCPESDRLALHAAAWLCTRHCASLWYCACYLQLQPVASIHHLVKLTLRLMLYCSRCAVVSSMGACLQEVVTQHGDASYGADYIHCKRYCSAKLHRYNHRRKSITRHQADKHGLSLFSSRGTNTTILNSTN